MFLCLKGAHQKHLRVYANFGTTKNGLIYTIRFDTVFISDNESMPFGGAVFWHWCTSRRKNGLQEMSDILCGFVAEILGNSTEKLRESIDGLKSEIMSMQASYGESAPQICVAANGEFSPPENICEVPSACMHKEILPAKTNITRKPAISFFKQSRMGKCKNTAKQKSTIYTTTKKFICSKSLRTNKIHIFQAKNSAYIGLRCWVKCGVMCATLFFI